MPQVGLRLTPYGHLVTETRDDAPDMDAAAAARLTAAFRGGNGAGLLQLGAAEGTASFFDESATEFTADREGRLMTGQRRNGLLMVYFWR